MSYLISVIIIFAVLVILSQGMLRISRRYQENQIALAYMETLQSYYLSIQDQVESARKFRHDLAKHIQTLEFLMEKYDRRDLRDYTDSLKDEFHSLQEQKICRNDVVNAVISIKKAECAEKNISFEVQIGDHSYDSVEEIDLVGLLFNLLDNAIEENEKIPDPRLRKISLSMNQQNNIISIEVKNSLRTGKEVQFQTEKKDKSRHGIGLTIVRYLVKKYYGTCRTKADSRNNSFIVAISLSASSTGEK